MRLRTAPATSTFNMMTGFLIGFAPVSTNDLRDRTSDQ
ncbi:hypothetical protein BJQ90_01658 [Arthrobacter sp. SO3]|nr:hypothetical protein [Arthrobacter sp. SO3]